MYQCVTVHYKSNVHIIAEVYAVNVHYFPRDVNGCQDGGSQLACGTHGDANDQT